MIEAEIAEARRSLDLEKEIGGWKKREKEKTIFMKKKVENEGKNG